MAFTANRTAWAASAPDFSTFLPIFWDSVLGESLFPNLTLYGFGSKRSVPRK